MKKFANILLGIVFAILTTSSIQYVSAEHFLVEQGIFKDGNTANLVPTDDSEYLIHLQIVVRNIEGQLVSVSESKHGMYIPHKITDQMFTEELGTKEIIKINGMKYQKAQVIQPGTVNQNSFPNFEDTQSLWGLTYCIQTNEHGYENELCIPVFQTMTPHVSLEENDTFTLNWSILRALE